MHTCVGAYTYYLYVSVFISVALSCSFQLSWYFCVVVNLAIIVTTTHCCYIFLGVGGWVWSLSSFCILTIVFSRSTCGLGAGGCGARIEPVVLVYFRSRVTRRGVYFYDGPHITKPSNPSDDTRHQIASKSRKTIIYESCPSTCPKL